MLVILIGAIGGLMRTGIIGLLVGAAVLAIGYIVFMAWINDADGQTENYVKTFASLIASCR